MAKENSSCLGSLVKGVLYFCFLPITLPVSIIKWAVNGRKRNRRRAADAVQDELITVLYGKKNIGVDKVLTSEQIFNTACEHVDFVGNFTRAAIDKMNATRTPHVFFENACAAEKYLNTLPVVERFYPQLCTGSKFSIEEFRRMRIIAFKAFADRFMQSVERETKQSMSRGAAQLSRLKPYENQMLPEERQYFYEINKKYLI